MIRRRWDTLGYTVFFSPARGSMTGAAPDLYYTSVTDYHDNDAFTFMVNNGTIGSDEAFVHITIRATAPGRGDGSGAGCFIGMTGEY